MFGFKLRRRAICMPWGNVWWFVCGADDEQAHFRSGRAFFHVAYGAVDRNGDYLEDRNLGDVEWYAFKRKLGPSVELSVNTHESRVRGHLSIPFFGLYWGFGQDRGRARRFGLSWHSGGLWGHWNDNEWGDWSRGQPWWQSWHFDPADFFLGQQWYSKETVATADVAIPLPEGAYPAVATTERCTWKRPRWPFPTVRTSVTIDCTRGIPIPGKGENSWDCDDDALFGWGSTTVAEAIGHGVAIVLRDRERYGGSRDWRPSGGFKVPVA